MKGAVILIFMLLTTASLTGQSLSQSRHALGSNSWRLTRMTLRSGSFLSSLLAIFGSVLTLSLIAVGSKRSLWPKLHRTVKTSHQKTSCIVTPAYVTPIYVHRITQARVRLAQRRVTQVCANIGLMQTNSSDTDTQYDYELLKKKREKNREKRKERLTKGPRIDPDKLKRINHDWRLFYGFKIRDLFHVENELDNTVCKVPCFDSKKSKTVKFDDSVKVVFIERNNTGRRVNRRNVPSHVPICPAPKFTSGADIIV